MKSFQLIAVIFVIVLASFNNAFSQEPLPKDFESKVKAEYQKQPEKEIKYQYFLEAKKKEYQRVKNLEKKITSAYEPKMSKSICGNGDFESGIDQQEWLGGWGNMDDNPNAGLPLLNSMTSGFVSGSISDPESRQTIVNAGIDLNAVQMVHTGAKALRLGNEYGNGGVGFSLISKTFKVDQANSTIRFWYAAVLQEGRAGIHSTLESQPSFWVRILDGNIYSPGFVNLDGLGGDKIAANSSSFFEKKGDLRIKNWDCVEIDLSSFAGKNKEVTIQFITENCWANFHTSYVYIDDFCGNCKGSPTGSISPPTLSSDCSKGNICFDYSLPKDPNGVTGTVQINLNIIQNGSTTSTITSPVLATGTKYCFQFDPCRAKELKAELGGFDYYASANFTHPSASIPPKTLGGPLNGQTTERNDDCELDCNKISFDPCCPPMNADLMKTLFKIEPGATLNAPYKIKFLTSPLFTNSSQAYCDYIKTLYPSVNRLTYEWRLYTAGNVNTPVVTWVGTDLLPQGRVWNWFVPQGNGILQSTTNFFDPELVVNKWYRVHVGMFTEPASDAFKGAECSGKSYFFVRIQVINGMRKATISDGKNIIAEMDINAPNKKN